MLAASPAVGWSNEVLYKYEKEFAKKRSTKPLRVYMTVGDVERGRQHLKDFSSTNGKQKLSSVPQIKSLREYRAFRN
jgi:hypothetical protein